MMHAAATSSPPPELNSSDSTKSSSSLNSASYPGGREGVTADLAHFEDIGLEDDDEDTDGYYNTSFDRTIRANSMPIRSVFPSSLSNLAHTSHQQQQQQQHQQQQPPPLRESSLLGRNYMSGALSREGLQRPSVTTDYKPPPQTQNTMKLRSPAAIIRERRSRTPSPAAGRFNSMPISLGPTSAPFQTKRDISPRRVVASLNNERNAIRRQSKTAEEREEECTDSNDDEELSEDVYMYNVPISPVVGPGGTTTTTPPQRHDSITGDVAVLSPSSSSTHLPMPPSGPYLSIPSLPGSRPHTSHGLEIPKNGSRPSSRAGQVMSRKSSSGTIPLSPVPAGMLKPKTRSKSWSAAMDQLSDEAQILTEIMEMQQAASGSTLGDLSSKPRWQSHSKSSVSLASVELPPLRKLNVMIDPLPPSKEKLTVLTRTRPSWLPPKSKSEERRHLKEYEKMVIASQTMARKKMEKAKAEEDFKERTRANIAKAWEELVIPNWDNMIKEPRTRELWWRGIAPKSRYAAWKSAIGNDLGLTEVSFTAALNRAHDIEITLSTDSGRGRHDSTTSIATVMDEEARQEHINLFHQINVDINSTYPHLHLFQRGDPSHQALKDAVHAYIFYAQTYPYHPSLTRIAAQFLLASFPPADTFISMSNLLNRQLPVSFATNDSTQLTKLYDLCLKAMHYGLPQLTTHLETTLHLPPSRYLAPMLRSLFSLALPPDVTTRIWDVYVFENDPLLVRTVVGVLGLLEDRLYGDRESVLALLTGGREWDLRGMSEDDVMYAIREAGKEKREDESRTSR
jgi:hypothetical protein